MIKVVIQLMARNRGPWRVLASIRYQYVASTIYWHTCSARRKVDRPRAKWTTILTRSRHVIRTFNSFPTRGFVALGISPFRASTRDWFPFNFVKKKKKRFVQYSEWYQFNVCTMFPYSTKLIPKHQYINTGKKKTESSNTILKIPNFFPNQWIQEL